MRVLVAAYACEPGRGSEQGAGWNLVTQLARHHEVWVVTRANNEALIEAALAKSPVPNLHFQYADIASLLAVKRLPGGLYLYHYAWHLSLKPLASRLHRTIGFDVAHHLTLGSFRYPSGLAHLGIPLVIGPVGGGEETPLALWRSFGWRGMLIEGMRWASNRAALLDPLVRSSYRQAAFTLVVTRDTRDRLEGLVSPEKMQVLPQSGVDPAGQGAVSSRVQGTDALKVLYVARLVHWKGWDLALRGFAAARRIAPLTLTILGTGPEEKRVRALIDELGIIAAVTWIRRFDVIDEVYRLYRDHDVFLFPSLHESGGMAPLEAMAAGLPVVCLDLGGPGVSVTPDCGIAVPPTTTERVVDGMASALLKLARDPALRHRMGTAARRRATEDYSWETKAKAIADVYQRLMSDPSEQIERE
jgi:glycosyltransferase involved in cell wall biosynthesis